MTKYQFLMYILPYFVWFSFFFPYNNIYKLLEGLFKDKLHEECFQVFSHHHGEGLFTILYKTHKAIIIQIMR